MNIQEALKETGKARKSSNSAEYVELIADENAGERKNLVWEGDIDALVHYTDIMADDWQPYHPKEEIRPKEAGEFWKQGDGDGEHHYYFTFEEKGILRFRSERIHDFVDWPGMIHNQNGWKRLYPEVPNENEIVIEGVTWHNAVSGSPTFPIGDTSKYFNSPFKCLKGKPPMTMKLIPKEKDNEG